MTVRTPFDGSLYFQLAWCSFWAPFHPGSAAADPLSGLLRAPSVRAEPGALRDAAARHHCYELHIGFTHLGWNVRIPDMGESWMPNAVARRRVRTGCYERSPCPHGRDAGLWVGAGHRVSCRRQCAGVVLEALQAACMMSPGRRCPGAGSPGPVGMAVEGASDGSQGT